MPTICFLNGIMIIMHLTNKEHNPPHIHAIYGEYEATFYIVDGELYEGGFPINEKKLVKKFVIKYSNELLEMWKTGNYYKLPPIN